LSGQGPIPTFLASRRARRVAKFVRLLNVADGIAWHAPYRHQAYDPEGDFPGLAGPGGYWGGALKHDP